MREAKQLLEARGHTLVEIEIPDMAGYSRMVVRELFRDQGKAITASLQPDEPVTVGFSRLNLISKLPRCVMLLIKHFLRN